ncbi:MAG: hypothetical protein L0219_07365 [Phycisphaerales bacterium]|nr:hypothetical protein [Phycisphaerales bacterium]
MADSKNREAARKRLAELFDADFGQAGDQTVTAVLNYSTVDLEGKTPVVMISSAGANRPNREGFGADSEFALEARYQVTIYVALPQPTDTSYTHLQAEDLLDLLDKRIADVIIENGHNQTAYWSALRYEPGFSGVLDVELPGGHRYMEEKHFVVAKLR